MDHDLRYYTTICNSRRQYLGQQYHPLILGLILYCNVINNQQQLNTIITKNQQGLLLLPEPPLHHLRAPEHQPLRVHQEQQLPGGAIVIASSKHLILIRMRMRMLIVIMIALMIFTILPVTR